jgi:hypothetical protein
MKSIVAFSNGDLSTYTRAKEVMSKEKFMRCLYVWNIRSIRDKGRAKREEHKNEI